MRRIATSLLIVSCLMASAQVRRPARFTTSDHARQTALAFEQQGKFDQAEEAWKAIAKANTGNAEAFAHLGLLASRQQHYQDAIPFYRKSLALNPNVPALRLDLGLALFKSGEFAAATSEFETLLKSTSPNSPELLRLNTLTGMSYYGLARYKEAAPYLQRAVDRDPRNLTLLLSLAHSYLWSKQSQKVLDVYHQILEINPDSAEADMLAGEALDELKDGTGAIAMFRAAVKADPKLPNVHFGLGYLLWTQKQYAEAAAEFQAELANDPDHEQSMLHLGDTLIQLNRTAEAESVLRKALALSPDLGLAHLDLGIIAMDAGRNEEALAELTTAAHQIPNDVNVHWRLGRLYRSLGRKEEARVEFDKANSINKAVDDNLLKKIAEGRAKPPAAQEAPIPQKP